MSSVVVSRIAAARRMRQARVRRTMATFTVSLFLVLWVAIAVETGAVPNRVLGASATIPAGASTSATATSTEAQAAASADDSSVSPTDATAPGTDPSGAGSSANTRASALPAMTTRQS